MKLMLIVVGVFSASLSAQAAASPGAYDKLRKMFDAASAPARIADIHALATKMKACASSEKSSPNEISDASKVISVTYTSPSFGPDFPSTTLNGLALSSTATAIRTVYEDFFTSYRETLVSNELQLTTTSWWDGTSCYRDSDDVNQCDDVLKSEAANVVVRVSAKYLLYKNGEEYAYCWQ
jgi:hypothetical protein